MKPKHRYAHMRGCIRIFLKRNLKVGCVLVKDNRIISIGYNGHRAVGNECEVEFTTGDGTHDHVEMITKPEVNHAEQMQLQNSRGLMSQVRVLAFITHAPCLSCAKMLYFGIIEVVYVDPYKSKEGLQFLEKCGIKVSQLYFEETT